MFGNRREERREDRQTFGRGGNANRYQMRQRMISIGDDFCCSMSAFFAGT